MIDISTLTESKLAQMVIEGTAIAIDLNDPDWADKMEFFATGQITTPMDPESQEYKDFLAAHPL